MQCAVCKESDPKTSRSYPCTRVKGQYRYVCKKCLKDHEDCQKTLKDLTDRCGVAVKDARGSAGFAHVVQARRQGAVGFPDYTHRVEQGFHATVNLGPNYVVGTRGCATCVGVIATLTGNRVFCAHLDHDVKGEQPRGIDEDKAWQKTKASIYGIFPPYDEVREIALTSTANHWVTGLTIKAIKEIYGVKVARPLFNRDAIWWTGGQVAAGEGAGHANRGNLVRDGRGTFRMVDGALKLCPD